MIEFLIENKIYIEKITLLTLVVGTLVIAHILAKVFYNTNTLKETFNKQKLTTGVIKGIIVVFIIVAITFGYLVFIYLKVVNETITDPMILLYGIALFYFTKLIKTLSEILGYDIGKTKDRLPKIDNSIQEVNKNKLQDYINKIDDILE